MKLLVHVPTDRVVGCHMVRGTWGRWRAALLASLAVLASQGTRCAVAGRAERRVHGGRQLCSFSSTRAAAPACPPVHATAAPRARPFFFFFVLVQVGPDAAEIMQGLGIALKCNATKAQARATQQALEGEGGGV